MNPEQPTISAAMIDDYMLRNNIERQSLRTRVIADQSIVRETMKNKHLAVVVPIGYIVHVVHTGTNDYLDLSAIEFEGVGRHKTVPNNDPIYRFLKSRIREVKP